MSKLVGLASVKPHREGETRKVDAEVHVGSGGTGGYPSVAHVEDVPYIEFHRCVCYVGIHFSDCSFFERNPSRPKIVNSLLLLIMADDPEPAAISLCLQASPNQALEAVSQRNHRPQRKVWLEHYL